MAKLVPLKPDDPRLRKICQPITSAELRNKDTQQLIEVMLDYVYGTGNKGQTRDLSKPSTVGLSANQLGIMKQISIVDLAIGSRTITDLHVLINPKIVWQSKTVIMRQEGCVNLAAGNVRGIVPRSKKVIVEALDRSGNELRLTLSGLPARLLQHEIDHLNGHLLIDRISDPKHAHKVTDEDRRDYLKMKKENWRKYVDVSDLVRPL